jgi:hypothetical protein
VTWAGKSVIVWPWGPCADWYNLYKLTTAQMTDLDGDGIADDYGSCQQPDLVLNEAPDSTVPLAGSAGFYLVSGENTVGEGTFGFASNGGERPNAKPCP